MKRPALHGGGIVGGSFGADFGSAPDLGGVVVLTVSTPCQHFTPRAVKDVPVLEVTFTDKKPKESK